MRICVIHLGDVCDCLVASSLNRGFIRKYPQSDITWVVKGEEQKHLLECSKLVSKVVTHDLITTLTDKYDLLVNLCPSFHPSDPVVDCEDVTGFCFNENSGEYYDILYGNKKTNMNVFQVYYRLCDMKWRGEGYDLNYFPKTRTKKKLVAVSVDHAKIKHLISDKLNGETFDLTLVPYKKNVFKRMDEINRAARVVTDDQLTMHLAIYLRKDVNFLEIIPMNTRPEFFGRGRVHQVPVKIVK